MLYYQGSGMANRGCVGAQGGSVDHFRDSAKLNGCIPRLKYTRVVRYVYLFSRRRLSVHKTIDLPWPSKCIPMSLLTLPNNRHPFNYLRNNTKHCRNAP